GHFQTLAGVYLPGRRFVYKARQHRVTLDDGDQIVLHDDCPEGWQPGDRVALLIHGLAGCHQSIYMLRIAARLEELGVRAFRMDLRGCGAGVGLARLPYHAGRSEDAAAALETIARLCPASPVALVGFSMGGNIALKLLGELGEERCGHLDRAVAVCPPFDLLAAVRHVH
ncbi:MAG TPA: alpha/beta fold hydrolase, partial [Pirellulales bacterium]|nr:alpha/beta fold hydrolase [Pirellulales bacterium]